MIVQPSTIAAIEGAPNFEVLIEEYSAEASTLCLPNPSPDMAFYRRLEAAGYYHALAATDDDGLIGFIGIVSTPLPHGGLMAATESFFVTKPKRGTAAGLVLLHEAEQKARAIGAPGLGVSAPVGSHLAELLPRLGYTHTNLSFFKRFLHA